MMNLDEGTLIAYVDGELDSQTAREVEAKLRDDPQARKFVERLREIAALSRVAFNDTLHEPVPQQLRDAITATLAQAPSSQGAATVDGNVVAFQPRPPAQWRKALPIAAAFAGVLLGLSGGIQYAETNTQKAMQLASMSMMHDQAAMEAALNKALEVNLSGNELAWQNPDSNRSARFTPVRTYQDKSGKYCREYRKDVTTTGKTETTYGLACRTDEGTWKTRYLILEDGAGKSL
ncbi:RT0821/Lpp0805 family surface protein [Magnetovibrio sp.]|uniref:RT0821/Lpp0805 family surface protein n=1 Tax=Magnetovibrio sp. TaxID=2024836 RepID=UPI002F948253